jgi:hypothetical protein
MYSAKTAKQEGETLGDERISVIVQLTIMSLHLTFGLLRLVNACAKTEIRWKMLRLVGMQ